MSYLLLVRTSRAFLLFFFNDTAPTEIYTLSLHDALPISPDFSIAPSQTGLTITAGQSASMNIVVTPTFSLSSAVQFQVPTPVIQGITCSVSPAQVQFSGANSATATLTFSVHAPSSTMSTT